MSWNDIPFLAGFHWTTLLIYGSLALVSFRFIRRRGVPIYVVLMFSGLTTIFSITMWEYYVNTIHWIFLGFPLNDPGKNPFGWAWTWALWGMLAFFLLTLIKYDFNIDWEWKSSATLLFCINFVITVLWWYFPNIFAPFGSSDYIFLGIDLCWWTGNFHRFIGSAMFTVLFFGGTRVYKKSTKVRVILLLMCLLVSIPIILQLHRVR